ncbi:MAG: sugar phosphate isomerase/epimerase [Actinomycetota bacterium]|nr:sugar phosphate isomerase/epimerase [Actinomycetota bacterium]
MTAFVTDVLPYVSDPGLRRLRSEIEARGTRINCVDVYLGWYPGHDPASVAGEASPLLRATEHEVLGIAEALGAEHVSIAAPFAGEDAPIEQVIDSLGEFTRRASQRGIRPHLEISNGSKVSSVTTAMQLLDGVADPDLGIVLDTYNLIRAGGTPSDVDELPLDRVFQIQLVDGAEQPVGDRFYDSLHCRQLPGDGDLPVAEVVRRLRARGPLPPVGPEVFNDELASLSVAEAAERAAVTTRAFLASILDPATGGSDVVATP